MCSKDWQIIHEITNQEFRLELQRAGEKVSCVARGGWTTITACEDTALKALETIRDTIRETKKLYGMS